MSDLTVAFKRADKMQDLAASHGKGCNFEDEDRFSLGRRHIHQAIVYGFPLCFVSTSVATIVHYGFGMHAPYGFWSLPKSFGISGAFC